MLTWISVHEASKLCGTSNSAIWKAVKQERLQYRHVDGRGRGGKVLQIALESLPPETQARYNGEQQEEQRDILLSLTGEQRDKTFHREFVVLEYQRFKAEYPKTDKLQAFLKFYNEQHPDETLTKRQLNHWENLYERDGIAGLVDRRGGYNKGQTSIPDDVKQVFLAYWMQEKGTKRGGPTITSCYRLTQLNFPERQLPSIAAFERLTQKIPYPAKVFAREGKKAYSDKCEPYIPFDYRSICTNRQWIADNHVFDVLVKDENGRVFRPWLIGWQDRRSRYITGYLIIDHDPNADAILDAFIRAVIACGIPESVLLDNGKDYTVRDLFNRNFTLSLANEMSLAVTNALPYNAKAKPIERFFNTLEYSYCIHLPSYIGSNPKRRPEKMQKISDKLKDEAMPFSEFCTFIDNIIKAYNNTSHSGNGMEGKTPCQAYVDFIERPILVANPDLLSMYFKRTSRLLTVGRNGIRVPELQQYYDDERLFPYQRQKVYARYNTDDVRQVYVFSEADEFICSAASLELGNLDQEITAQNMRLLNSKKREYRKMVKDFIPGIHVPSAQELAIKCGFSFTKPDLKVLPTVTAVDPNKQEQAKAIQKEEARQEERRKPADQQKDASGMTEAESLRLLAQMMEQASGGI